MCFFMFDELFTLAFMLTFPPGVIHSTVDIPMFIIACRKTDQLTDKGMSVSCFPRVNQEKKKYVDVLS